MKSLVRLSPLIALYVLIVVLAAPHGTVGDEARYLRYAQNLLHGTYSPPGRVELSNGPGYPLLLTPFVAARAVGLPARLLNAALLFGAVLYLHAAFRPGLARGPALIAAYLVGLYPPFLRYLPLLLTEIATVFLVAAFTYHVVRALTPPRGGGPHLILAGLFLGYVALTKVFFGYVIPMVLVFALVVLLFRRRREWLRAALIAVFALAFTVPYLVYTRSITGKTFYWGTYGGASLYWMTTPYPDETGDWRGNSIEQLRERDDPLLLERHGSLFERLAGADQVRVDESLKRAAIANLHAHPARYLANWAANVSRMLFNAPYTHAPATPSMLLYAIPNAFLLTLAVLALIPTLLAPHEVPPAGFFLLATAVIAAGGSSLLSAYPRQLFPVVPMLAVWMAGLWNRAVSVRVPA